MADGDGILWTYEAGSKKLASVEIKEGFGEPTPTPTTTPTTTAVPTAEPTATPAPVPGFGFLIATSILLALAVIKSR
jgi:hypothetical protein